MVLEDFSKTDRPWGCALKLRRSCWFHHLIYHLGNACFRILYRLEIEGRQNIPSEGPCVILPKHQFWTDIPIVGIAAVRPGGTLVYATCSLEPEENERLIQELLRAFPRLEVEEEYHAIPGRPADGGYHVRLRCR